MPLNIITEYKFEDHKGIPVVYYKQLEDRKLYAKMIYLLYKANKNNIKQLAKMLNEASENKMMLGYSNIHYIIVKEYEKIKYIN